MNLDNKYLYDAFGEAIELARGFGKKVNLLENRKIVLEKGREFITYVIGNALSHRDVGKYWKDKEAELWCGVIEVVFPKINWNRHNGEIVNFCIKKINRLSKRFTAF